MTFRQVVLVELFLDRCVEGLVSFLDYKKVVKFLGHLDF